MGETQAASAEPGKARTHLVTLAELRSADAYARFEDPDGLARMSEPKRQALLHNPMVGDDRDPVQILGTRDDRVIGRIDLLAGQVAARVGAEMTSAPMLWASEFSVAEQHRNSLMGVMLILKMQRLGATLGACSVSRMALPVFQKLKWLDLTMPRYLLMRRSRAVMQRYLGAGPGGRIAAASVDAALLGQRAALRAVGSLRTMGLRCAPAESLPPEFDSPPDPLDRLAATRRPAAWVSWVLTHSFSADPRDRRGLFLVRDRAGRPRGWFLIKSRFHEIATHRGFRNLWLGSLADWRVLGPDRLSMSAILLFAIRELSAWGVDAIETCLPPDWDGPPLRRWGFARMGDLHLLLKPGVGSPLCAPEFQQPAAWSVRPADGDNIFI